MTLGDRLIEYWRRWWHELLPPEPDDEDEAHCSLDGYMLALEIRTVYRV